MASFTADFSTALSRAATTDELVDIVARHRDAGLTRHQAERALLALRAQVDEATEDRVLDVLDYVVGFCNADQRLFP